MCLLSTKTKEQVWKVEDLLESLGSNPDGFGFAGITEEGGIRVAKGFTDKELKATLPLFQDLQAIFHARLATHGSRDASQLHPYRVIDELYMAHNGIFNIPTPDRTKSDTWHMARRIASLGADGVTNLLTNPEAFKKFEDLIATNKVAFIHPEIGIKIANKELGHEGPGGCWYSNDSYKSFVYTKSNANFEPFGWAYTADEMLRNWLNEGPAYLREMIIDDLMTDPEVAAAAIVKLVNRSRLPVTTGTKLRMDYEKSVKM